MEKILVTIGHPSAPFPILPFCMANVQKGEELHIAKQIRKDVAENTAHFGFPREFGGFAPAELYWAIFENTTDEKPVLASDNWYWRKYKDFTQENVQPMEVMTPAGNSAE